MLCIIRKMPTNLSGIDPQQMPTLFIGKKLANPNTYLSSILFIDCFSIVQEHAYGTQ